MTKHLSILFLWLSSMLASQFAFAQQQTVPNKPASKFVEGVDVNQTTPEAEIKTLANLLIMAEDNDLPAGYKYNIKPSEIRKETIKVMNENNKKFGWGYGEFTEENIPGLINSSKVMLGKDIKGLVKNSGIRDGKIVYNDGYAPPKPDLLYLYFEDQGKGVVWFKVDCFNLIQFLPLIISETEENDEVVITEQKQNTETQQTTQVTQTNVIPPPQVVKETLYVYLPPYPNQQQVKTETKTYYVPVQQAPPNYPTYANYLIPANGGPAEYGFAPDDPAYHQAAPVYWQNSPYCGYCKIYHTGACTYGGIIFRVGWGYTYNCGTSWGLWGWNNWCGSNPGWQNNCGSWNSCNYGWPTIGTYKNGCNNQWVYYGPRRNATGSNNTGGSNTVNAPNQNSSTYKRGTTSTAPKVNYSGGNYSTSGNYSTGGNNVGGGTGGGYQTSGGYSTGGGGWSTGGNR
jgi:hypothetical protein